ncbi:hypothetical protein GW17_00032679 [Ensete ventricosum]|nr:hypothetical protein GW17_00032679 [Ensete ventricosum]
MQTDLDGAMVAVTREAEGAEGAVHAVETVHIALALVGVSVQLALHEEARRQQRAQPRRPLLLLLLLLPSRSLFQSLVSEPAGKHKTSRTKRDKATSFRTQDKHLTMIPLFLLSSSLNGDS